MTADEIIERVAYCSRCGDVIELKWYLRLLFKITIWLGRRAGMSDSEIIIDLAQKLHQHGDIYL